MNKLIYKKNKNVLLQYQRHLYCLPIFCSNLAKIGLRLVINVNKPQDFEVGEENTDL